MWYVPITVAKQDSPPLDNHIPSFWLSNNQTNTTYEHETGKWIVLNIDATGFYRVLYDAHFTSLILQQLKLNASKIPALSRSQLLDDYFHLAYKGEFSSNNNNKIFHNMWCRLLFDLVYNFNLNCFSQGYVHLETALDLTTYLSQEDHFTVLEVVFNQFRKLYNFIEMEDKHVDRRQTFENEQD